MGLYDRDYIRQPRGGGVGTVRLWSVTTWLIVINIVVFVLDGVLARFQMERAMRGGGGGEGFYEMARQGSLLMAWGSFSIGKGIMQGQVWRFITYQFLHEGIWHIAMNMIALWLLGPVVELRLGARRYLIFYLVCGVAGAATFAGLWGMGILFPAGPRELFVYGMEVPMVGASASIFGVLLAAAYLSPERMIYIYFFDIPLKYLAWILVGIAAYVVLVNGDNAGGQAAHLGGALAGWVLIRQDRLWNITMPRRRLRRRSGKEKDWSKDFNR